MKIKDIVHGGKADNKPDTDYNQDQLQLGIKTELEHTDNPTLAKEIAKDHLEEDPNYYTKLHQAKL